MSDDFSKNKPRLPSHVVFHVKDRSGNESDWHRISGLWPSKNGSLTSDIVPFGGRLVVWPREELERMRKERKAEQEQDYTQDMTPKL